MMFVLKPSRTYLWMLLFTHLAVSVAIFLTYLPGWSRAGLLFLIAASLLHQWHLHLHAGWQSFWLEKRSLRFVTRSGLEKVGSVSDRTVVMPCCVVLCARLEGERRPVCQLIFQDALPKDTHRELRVRLKFSQ